MGTRTLTVQLTGDSESTLAWARYLAGECEYRLGNESTASILEDVGDGTAGVREYDDDEVDEVTYSIVISKEDDE